MPDEYKGVEFDAPVRENQTRATPGAASSARDIETLRGLTRGERPVVPPTPAELRRQEAIANHLAQSGTRRTIDAICFVAYASLGLELGLSVVGLGGMIQTIAWLTNVMRAGPLWLLGLFRPGLSLGTVGGDAVAIVMYAVAHVALRALHRKVTIERVGKIA